MWERGSLSCADPESFVRGGPNLITFYLFFCFFLVDEGIGDPDFTINGPSSTRQRNAINGVSLAGRQRPNIECWLGSFVIFQGIRTSIAKKTYIFVIFRGTGPPAPPPPSVSAHSFADFNLISLKYPMKMR